MAKNLGEENEIFLKAYLFIMFNKQKPLLGAHNIGTIMSLKFSPDGKLPVWRDEIEELLKARNYESLKKIFVKAPSGSKADLEINGIAYSVKYSAGAKAAIVNHTHRKNFLRALTHIHVNIAELDTLINLYWEKRFNNEIGEDICNRYIQLSPFANYKEYFKPILEYFMFNGTGYAVSRFPATKMLDFTSPDDSESFKVISKDEAVDQIWSSLTFSVRSKGLPKKYSAVTMPDIAPWVRLCSNDKNPVKGCLHIRL